MRGACSDCGQEIKENEKFCSLCKKPYDPGIEDDSEPIKERVIPTKLQIQKGVLAIIICAGIAIGAGVTGILLYLQNPDTPESIALDGINVLLNADIKEFTARHAFIEADIGLAIRTGRASTWDDAVLPLIWEIYNELEDILDVLEKGDIEINVADSAELTETDKDVALNKIYNTMVGDSDHDTVRAEMISSIMNDVSRLYRVDIEVTDTDTATSQDEKITVHVGMIDEKWLILSETMH